MMNIPATQHIEFPFPKPPRELSEEETQYYFEQCKQKMAAHDAVLIAHYYTDPLIQRLAEVTGGFVGDSLEMAKFGASHQAKTLIVAGVKFMGETAKMLSEACPFTSSDYKEQWLGGWRDARAEVSRGYFT